jgi:hypothetical protein
VTLDPRWTSTVSWQLTGDSIAPAGVLPTNDPGLHDPSIALDESFVVVIVVASPQPWGDGVRAGIQTVGEGYTISCIASCTGPASCELALRDAGGRYQGLPDPFVGADVTPVMHLRLEAEIDGSETTFRCQLEPLGQSSIFRVGGKIARNVGVIASPALKVRAIDVLD